MLSRSKLASFDMRRVLFVICLLGVLLFVFSIEFYLRNLSAWHALSVDLRDFTPTGATEAKIFHDSIALAEPEALWPMVGAILSITVSILGACALLMSKIKTDKL